MKLPTVATMQQLEKLAIEKYRVASIVLMENAGAATARLMKHYLGDARKSFCPVFIGPGNNGGDGLVIGRHLYQQGCLPVFFLLIPADNVKGDAKKNLDIVNAMGLPCHSIITEEQVALVPRILERFAAQNLRCYALVDAIFGTGLKRPVAGHFRKVIDTVNVLAQQQELPVFSADIASGLNADTGMVMGCSIKAEYTSAFGYAKPGHFIGSGKDFTGKLDIVDIGIPAEVLKKVKVNTELITVANFPATGNLLQRKPSAHKGDNGHLLVVAGADGYTGAAVLAARGALRAGAGLVTVVSTKQNNTILQTTIPEAMTMPLKNSDEFLSNSDWRQIKEKIAHSDCVVLGPGIGTHPDTTKLALRIFHEATTPVIVDADALNILACSRGSLHIPAGPRIYTPHPGELARLLKCSVQEILEDSFEATRKACHLFCHTKYPVIIVTKGAGTIIYSSEGKHFINTTGNPSMATGGMGDILSGMIAAFICQGFAPLPATVCGVYLHGLSGDILQQIKGTGFYSSELADTIPLARKQLFEEIKKEQEST